jgi:sterol 24-C-methyltransferase
MFGLHEWLKTNNYKNDNAHHRETRLGMEKGDGISNIFKVSEGLGAIKAACFTLKIHENLADRTNANRGTSLWTEI